MTMDAQYPPASQPSAAEQLLALLADPKAATKRLVELQDAIAAHEAAAVTHLEAHAKAEAATQRVETLTREVEQRHKSLAVREADVQRREEVIAKRAAELKRGEEELNSRRQVVMAMLNSGKKSADDREADLIRREQAVTDRENAVGTLKAQLAEREERLRKALG